MRTTRQMAEFGKKSRDESQSVLEPRRPSAKRPKSGDRKDLLMIPNVQTHQPSVLEVVSWLGLCFRDASETDSLVLVDDVTHDGSLRKRSGGRYAENCVQCVWEESRHAAREWPQTQCQHNTGLQNWPSKSPQPHLFYLPRKRLRSETPTTKETTVRNLESQQKSRSRQFLDASRLLEQEMRPNIKCYSL